MNTEDDIRLTRCIARHEAKHRYSAEIDRQIEERYAELDRDMEMSSTPSPNGALLGIFCLTTTVVVLVLVFVTLFGQ
jgi:hypothetical protein